MTVNIRAEVKFKESLQRALDRLEEWKTDKVYLPDTELRRYREDRHALKTLIAQFDARIQEFEKSQQNIFG